MFLPQKGIVFGPRNAWKSVLRIIMLHQSGTIADGGVNGNGRYVPQPVQLALAALHAANVWIRSGAGVAQRLGSCRRICKVLLRLTQLTLRSSFQKHDMYGLRQTTVH